MIGGNLAVATEFVSDGVEVDRALIHRRLGVSSPAIAWFV